MVGLSGFEPLTSRLSAVRSSQLSYRPVVPLKRRLDWLALTKACTLSGAPRGALRAPDGLRGTNGFQRAKRPPEGDRRWLAEN